MAMVENGKWNGQPGTTRKLLEEQRLQAERVQRGRQLMAYHRRLALEQNTARG